MHPQIAFIGGGNMASALIGGLIAAGHPASRLKAAETDTARAGVLRQQMGIEVADTAIEAARGANAIVLAVKPQQMKQALHGVQLAAGTVVISIAAGIRLDSLREWLGDGVQLVRTMPNTPALFGEGITGLYADPKVSSAARELAQNVMKAAGKTVWLGSENDMDAVTALSGSGPAYYFLLTEVLRDAGAKMGLSPETSAQLAQQTLIGAAAMVAKSGTDVTQLRLNVTSKGGTTEAAVKSLEASGIRQMFTEALLAAQKRGAELGNELAAAAR